MMASSQTYFCDEYHCSAGCVLFRFDTPKPQICLLHNQRTGEWVLPKGHKDLGETIEQAALRETYEETGWACRFLPTNVLTRVPPPGLQSGSHPREALASNESIAVTVRHLDDSGRNVKFVWWFIAEITGSERIEGTQMATESFETHFEDADVAVARLSRQGDRDVAERAVDLVNKTRRANSLPDGAN